MTLAEIIDDMQQAIDRKRQPRTGMHVPYHGPLASATPSVVKDVQWWVDRLREAAK